MKHPLILLGSLLLLSGALNSQNKTIVDTVNINCLYSLVFQLDSTDAGSKEEEFLVLQIGKNSTSKCTTYNTHYADSVGSVLNVEKKKGSISAEQMIKKVVGFPKSKFKFQIFKNYPNQKITYVDRIVRDTYVYEESLNAMQWSIGEEKKEVAGYACQKATTSYGGRDYVAWFTSEIPVSDGPYKFSGLPGLIVQIEDTKGYYRFELTKLEKVTEGWPITFLDKNKKVIHTTKKEFESTIKRFMHNTVEFYEQEGFSPISDEHEKRVRDRYKYRNNTIEVIK